MTSPVTSPLTPRAGHLASRHQRARYESSDTSRGGLASRHECARACSGNTRPVSPASRGPDDPSTGELTTRPLTSREPTPRAITRSLTPRGRAPRATSTMSSGGRPPTPRHDEVSMTRCLAPRGPGDATVAARGVLRTCPGPSRGRLGGVPRRGRRGDSAAGHARARGLRPIRCAFAARHHPKPLLIHRMSAQGDPPRESGPTRFRLARQTVEICIRRTDPQAFVQEMN